MLLLLLSHFTCLTLCDPIDGSPPGSPVPGILQARILEWVAISFSTTKWKEDVNGYFCNEDTEMGNKHMKNCSALRIIREMQIKTTVRYHLTLVRMAMIKKSTNNKC